MNPASRWLPDPGGPMGTDLHLEKLVLRLLCAGTSERGARDALTSMLHGYAWQSPLHQAIFNAIVAVPSDDPEVIRQFLPAKLTRMGFPDVEWAELFAPTEISTEDSMALVRQMLAGA